MNTLQCYENECICKKLCDNILDRTNDDYNINHINLQKFIKNRHVSCYLQYYFGSIIINYLDTHPLAFDNILLLEKLNNYEIDKHIRTICNRLLKKNNMDHEFYIYANQYGGNLFTPQIDKIDITNDIEISYFFSKIFRYEFLGHRIRKANIFIKKYINQCKITINILEAISDVADEELFNLVLMHKIIPNERCFDKLLINTNFNNVISKFCSVGFNITYEHILKSIEYNKYIPNTQDMNIVCDDRIAILSTLNKFHNYQDDLKFNYNLECLKIMCKNESIVRIKKIINSGIEPDQECFEIVCSRKNNVAIVKYFIEKLNFKPNIKCIRNQANVLKVNKTMNLLLDHYQEN